MVSGPLSLGRPKTPPQEYGLRCIKEFKCQELVIGKGKESSLGAWRNAFPQGWGRGPICGQGTQMRVETEAGEGSSPLQPYPTP